MSASNVRTRSVFPLVTCEHGGKRIPPEYARWFRDAGGALASHRGYDPGALAMARTLARRLGADLEFSTVSRLLVELNRSPHHRDLFSPYIRCAPASVRRRIFDRNYVPYREAVETALARAFERGRQLVHISSHSFTPMLDGVTRRADVGLLYDPRRENEAEFCRRWQRALRARAPGWVVRRNYPYRGDSDGLTAHLRERFPASRYTGIELEINQRHPAGDPRAWARMRSIIGDAVVETLRETTRSIARG